MVAVLNFVVPLINQFKPSPPPPVTKQDTKSLSTKEDLAEFLIKYIDQPIKPSIEEVKTDIEREFRAISLKKEEEALELYRKGDFAYNERRFTTAVFYYSEVLKKIESASVYLTKGNALIFLGRKDEAIVAYEKALDIKPDYAEACYNKGVALGDLGRMDEAIVAFEKSLEIKPDYADAWNNKGFVLGDLGRKDEALVAYEKALEIKPDYAEA